MVWIPVAFVYAFGVVAVFAVFTADALASARRSDNDRRRDARRALSAPLWPLMFVAGVINMFSQLVKAAR